MPDPKEFSDIYIDESSQTKARYLLLGGIIVPTHIAEAFSEGIADSRLPELPSGEAKWVKVSRTKLPAYKRMVDYFFDSGLGSACHFHGLVVDSHKVDHRRFNGGDREIGFNKEIYQLIMKFGRLYPRYYFHVYPDERQTRQAPNELRLILNRGCAKKGDKRNWPYRRCHFRSSKDCRPIQLVDIFIGALAFRLNGHYLAKDASPAKSELSSYVLERAGILDVTRDTATSGKFTIWHRRLR